MQKDEPLKVIVPLAVVLALVFGASMFFVAQRMGTDDHPPDGFPPLPQDRVSFTYGNTTQYDLVYYRTEVTVSSVWPPEGFSLDEVNITIDEDMDGEADDVNWSYDDVDGDGNISMGDVITFTGLTDEHPGGLMTIAQGDRDLPAFDVDWHHGSRIDHSVWLQWVYPIRETASGFDATFQITRLRCTTEVNHTEFRFELTDSDNLPLPSTQVLYNDTNGDGLVSRWDRVEVSGLPDGNYMGATLRMTYEGVLVGVDSVPFWTIE